MRENIIRGSLLRRKIPNFKIKRVAKFKRIFDSHNRNYEIMRASKMARREIQEKR